MNKLLTPVLGISFLLASLAAPDVRADDDREFHNMYVKAAHFVEEFDKEVTRAKGNPSTRFFNREDALRRVKELMQQYPDRPEVRELRKKTASILMRSKGDYMEITPEMLKWRDGEKRLSTAFSELSASAWKKLLQETGLSEKAAIFPAPDPQTVSLEDLKDKYVLIQGVEWPQGMFTGITGQYIAAGKPSSGYYYIEASTRSFIGPYEALKRYRREIDSSLGQEFKLSVIGRISGVLCDFPQAEEQKIGSPQWGWVVTPAALYVPGKALAFFDSERENSAYYVGEDDAEKIKAEMYSVNSVPENASPEKVMEIFCTAIKEKNFRLYSECINPERKATRTAESMIRYHWDLHQERFRSEYAAVTFDKASISVIKGHDADDDLESFILDDNQKNTLESRGGEKIEQAIVESKAYEESGKRRGGTQQHTLVRRNGGRWYVEDYMVRF